MNKPTVLILGPGGVHGFLELGSLLYLEQTEELSEIIHVCGVSIGAIIGLLWAVGYSASEIFTQCLHFTFLHSDRSFFDSRNWMEIYNITEKWSFFSSAKIQERLEELVRLKLALVPSFEQFFPLTGRHFRCVATNITENRVEYFDSVTQPALSVVLGVCMSAAVPGAFEPLCWNGCLYNDGALRDPLPAALYDNGSTDILILNISHRHVKYENGDSGNILSFLRHLYISYSAPVDELVSRSLKIISARCRYLPLPATTFDILGLTIHEDTKISMMIKGYLETRKIYLMEKAPPAPSGLTAFSIK